MRQSELFTKTRKEAPKDEVAKNAQLLIRGGFIHKELAGVYSYLPLGFRVLKKIENIIREEMNAVGGQEVFMSVLQDKRSWVATQRWNDNDVDIWFKTRLKNRGDEIGLGFTHEEALTKIMTEHVGSYRDLPKSVYQIQTKFRNEERAKNGLLRGREFLMKDLYLFTRSPQEHVDLHLKIRDAYVKIFDRVGIGNKTYITFASGGVFSEFSEEFQTLSDSGEDIIYVSHKENKRLAINKEICTSEILKKFGLSKDDMVEEKSIEVGNIFTLGTKFTNPLGLFYKDEDGKDMPVYMGSYGIGLGRLMATVVEVLSDDKGIVWPESIAPFDAHVIVLAGEEGKGLHTKAEKLVMELEAEGVSVLYDDRDVSAGEKFADADLIGIPVRAVISEKTGEDIEVKKRTEDGTTLVSKGEFMTLLGR